MLLESKTLVPREVTQVSMVNCWCAEMVKVRGSGDIFFFGIYLMTLVRVFLVQLSGASSITIVPN